MRVPTHEQALKSQGVKFEYLDKVTLAEINTTRGKQMQARLQPIDHALVDEYAKMLEEGMDPPPLLLWKPGRCLYVPLDGNQRINSMEILPKKKQRPFSAYVVETDDPMIADRLCWQFNNLVNGRRLSYDECLNHAVTFVRKYNSTINGASKDWGVKVWELQAKVTELELRDLGSKHNIDTSRVPATVILELNPLRLIGDDQAVKGIKVVAESGISQQDVRDVVRNKVNKAKTSKEKTDIIDEWASEEHVQRRKAETKGGKLFRHASRLPRERVQRGMVVLANVFDEFADKKAFQPVGKETTSEYRAMAIRICNRLIDIYGLGAFLEDK